MLQSVDENALVVSGAELLVLARLAHAGLAVIEKRDGATEGYRAVAVEVCRRAETERRRIEREARRSKRVSETTRAPRSFPAPPSVPTSAYISAGEAAELYSVSVQYIRRLASLKTVNAVKGPGGYSIQAASLAAWAAQRANRTDMAP